MSLTNAQPAILYGIIELKVNTQEGLIMDFSECLREYMEAASMNATQLAEAAGLSVSSVSRYLSGKQTPGDEVMRNLAAALSGTDTGAADVYSHLHRSATGIDTDYENCIENLKELLGLLNVSNNELARTLAYDPSHISRILGGSRRPSSLPQFLSGVSSYLGRKFYGTAQAPSILSITGHEGSISGAEELSDIILDWLGQPHVKESPQIVHFLGSLDKFDLNEFMASIHFDDIKVPTMPFQLPGSKTYTGIEEMMQAEIDFMKYAVLSKSDEDVILYSDMPIEEMSKDEEFPKKWMMGMALMIRKGLDLQMIHDVHRPLPEMLLGLEGWIPMYMTGQVHPYYLNDATNQHFMHFIRSAGSVAISGEAILGHHASGRYTVTRNKDDVAYYRQRAKDLLDRARPLMKIYNESQADELRRDVEKIIDKSRALHLLSNLPPLFTMSEGLLEDILSHSNASAPEKDRIREYHKKSLRTASSKLENLKYMLELSEVKPEDYEKHPARLPVSGIFPSADIRYTANEYRRHIEEARIFAKNDPGFSMTSSSMPAFRNIEITILPGRAVLVSKSNPPIIHFLILNPQMIAAFEQFAPPIYEPQA